MTVSDEPKKPAVSVKVSSAQAFAWLKANWPRYWEIALFAAIVAIAAGLRLWDLGARSFNHDESLHATYSWYLFNGQGYTHDPMMHGPFKFVSVAVIWKALGLISAAPILSNWVHWGPSDYAARLLPAIFGTGLVALPYFFRGYIGRTGALFAALFLAFSPVLLYFSRFIRDDIIIAFYTLAIVICIWRYSSERRTLYLYLIAGLLALGFATMEAIFLIAMLFLIYLDLLFAWEIAAECGSARSRRPPLRAPTDDRRPRRDAPGEKKRRPPRRNRSPVLSAGRSCSSYCAPFAWLLAITWPFTGKWRTRWRLVDWPVLRRSADHRGNAGRRAVRSRRATAALHRRQGLLQRRWRQRRDAHEAVRLLHSSSSPPTSACLWRPLHLADLRRHFLRDLRALVHDVFHQHARLLVRNLGLLRLLAQAAGRLSAAASLSITT